MKVPRSYLHARLAGTVRVLALGPMLLSAPAGAVEPLPDGSERLDEFVRVLGTCGTSEEELERGALELAGLPGAVQAYLALDTAQALPGADGQLVALEERQERLLDRVAERFEPGLVVQGVRDALAGAPYTGWQDSALALLGRHAGAGDLSLLVQLTTDERGVVHAARVPLFRGTLVEVLRREGVFARELEWLTEEAPALAATVVRAVGLAGDPGGLEWLGDLLDDPELGAAALLEIGRLAGHARGPLALETAAKVLPLLAAEEAGRRRHAIRALTALRQPLAVPHLVDVLERASSPGEERMVHTALRTLTGLELPASAGAWRACLERELRWLREEGPAAVELLSSETDAEVVTGIRQISERFLHRDLLATQLIPLLEAHPSPDVRGQVCLGLARLGSDAAVSALVEALEDEAPVRQRAHAALLAITGLDLPPERAAWREPRVPRR